MHAVISLASIGLGSTLGAVVGAGVNAIGVLVAFYYGLVGFSCAWYYRHALTSSLKSFLLVGVFPVFGAISLFGVGLYDCWSLWTSTDTLAVSASNGKFEVIVPAVVLIAAVPIFIYQNLRRHPAAMSARTESAAANALG